MIVIGNDKLYSESEILANVRAYVKKYNITKIDSGGFAFEILILAVALDEPEDFIRGAIKR